MTELLKSNWWIIWNILFFYLLLRYRLLKRGGSEPFLRRILYAFNSNLDPTNEKRPKLSVGVVAFALIGIAIAMAADIYLSL